MYKVLGILGEDDHSGKFVPAHFTQKRNISLKKGSFEQEYVIQMPDIVKKTNLLNYCRYLEWA